MRKFVKMTKIEQLRALKQLRQSNDENYTIRRESRENRAYSNRGAYCPPYKVDRFDGFHDND